MLAAALTGIAKIRCTAQKFAHLIARRKIDLKQIFDCVAIYCDTDFYVVAAGLFAPQAAQHPNSVASNHAVFFRPYYPLFAK